MEITKASGATSIAHGATGKGNDQVRFEFGALALAPDIKVIAPHREWDLTTRNAMMAYCEQHQIPVEFKRGDESPYSMDANLLHISYEGGELEDPGVEPSDSMWRRTVSVVDAPDEPEYIDVDFLKGDAVKIGGEVHSLANLLIRLNELGGRHGIGRCDMVENRFVGMKSRGCYETPGGTILLAAHRAMESLTLDREVMHLRDELMPKYAMIIYNGYWWSPERIALQTFIDETQKPVSGRVRMKLHKGTVTTVGRWSELTSLYDATTVTFDEDEGAYDQADATGFIRLNALRLMTTARNGRSNETGLVD